MGSGDLKPVSLAQTTSACTICKSIIIVGAPAVTQQLTGLMCSIYMPRTFTVLSVSLRILSSLIAMSTAVVSTATIMVPTGIIIAHDLAVITPLFGTARCHSMTENTLQAPPFQDLKQLFLHFQLRVSRPSSWFAIQMAKRTFLSFHPWILKTRM